MRIVTTFTILAFIPPAAHAAAGEIKGSEITSLVSGALVKLDTPLGKKIPIQYLADGRISGNAGELASYLGSPSDHGRWWVSGNELCHKWSKWFSGELQCLRLSKQGDRIHWQNRAGTSGTATIASAPPVAPTAPTSVAASGGEGTRMRLSGPAATSRAQPPEPAAPPTTRASPPVASSAYRVANVARDDVLNVRGGPSADDAVVGALKAEQQGITLAGECQSRWCPIAHGDTNGWVNAAFLVPERPSENWSHAEPARLGRRDIARGSPDAPRTCLTEPARALLDAIEAKFGAVRLISTCRPGATIAGTGRPSRHASGNAIDFDAGGRKGEIVAWLVANHKAGGTMTYPDMDHIHVDIGRHFISLAGNRTRTSRSGDGSEWPVTRMGLGSTRVR
jgi:hypothetical protein